MVGDGLRDLCDWWLEVGHDENCVTYAESPSERPGRGRRSPYSHPFQ